MNSRLISEWQKQDAIVIAWPNETTDWAENLKDVSKVYFDLACKIADHQKLLILSKELNLPEFPNQLKKNIKIVQIDYNDTWTRDYIGLSVEKDNERRIINFKFNAWGDKFGSNLDNTVNIQLEKKGLFIKPILNHEEFVLEGGSVEINDQNELLTSKQCLLNNNRNPNLNQSQIEQVLKNNLGVKDIIWIENGEIPGDDTDAHIDTLARFCNDNTIAYSIDNSIALKSMEKELKNKFNKNQILVPLPLPKPLIHNGNRIPGSYVNFLITNKKVLVPTYNDPNDTIAINQLQKLFPNRKIQGVNCIELIKQNGSLHCITMQIAEGILNLSLWDE